MALPETSDTGHRAKRLHALVDELEEARLGTTFNQYRETGGDDASPEAPRLRRENLRRYLVLRRESPVVIVAEAGGWRGSRYSGLTLYCERQFPGEPTGAGEGFRRTSRHPRGWSEPSATIVQRALASGGWQRQVLLWNTVPTHPAGPTPHSNRTPTRAEVERGRELLDRLLAVVRPAHLLCLGRVAASALPDGVPVVRHPANGGASLCTEGIQRLLSGWLPGPHPQALSDSDGAGPVGAGAIAGARNHGQRM